MLKQKICWEKNVIELQYDYDQMGQSIQEWTKQNLWKTAFKKIEVIWSILEYFFPNLVQC